MILQASVALEFGGLGSGCHGPTCGRKPSTMLMGTAAFKDPSNKSFIVTTGGKVYGTAAPQAHDTLLLFYQPHIKGTMQETSSQKFLASGGIEASIRMPGIKDRDSYVLNDRYGHIAVAKATPDVLTRLVQVIEHLDADTIEMQIGKEYYTGPKEKVRMAIRHVLQEAA